MSHFFRKKVLEQFDYRCASCFKHESDLRTVNNRQDVLTIDHIIKKSDGGSERLENLQPLCRACHSKKDNQPRARKA